MVNSLPIQVKNMLAKREHRMHHYLWHAVRDGWLRFDQATRDSLTAKGWQPPRPSRDSTGRPINSNSSGEDFLFMHRQMIIHVNNMLSQIQDPSYPQVEGWLSIPGPGDIEYPVPVWINAPPTIQESKTDDYYNNNIVKWEAHFLNQNELAQMTLGQLGTDLEYTIHNAMHRRWAADPGLARPSINPTASDTIDTMSDNPSYDFMADTYSSHVNSIFWKLHGWVDNRIENWMQAQEITGPVPWTVQWDRNMMPSHNIVHSTDTMAMMDRTSQEEQSVEEMTEVVKIISRAKVFPSFEVFEDLIP
jgi:hypothetical protein